MMFIGRLKSYFRRVKWLLTLSYTLISITTVILVSWWAFIAVSIYLASVNPGLTTLQILQLRVLPVLQVILPSMLLLIVPAAAVSTYFGFLTARWLDNRLFNLRTATQAWQQGDFTVTVVDELPDEIGNFAHDLNHMARQFETLLLAQQDLAALEERYRLASDLHDSVKQQITAAMFQISAAQALIEKDPQAARTSMEHAGKLTHAAQKEMSAIIFELRPAALEGKGLVAALRKYVEEWSEQTGASVTLRIEGDNNLSAEIERIVFRIVQEALSNVARHAHTNTASIGLVFALDELSIEITDEGVGFSAGAEHTAGYGIQNMHSRIRQLGGEMTILSSPGQGTCVSASIPLQKSDQELLHG
jgi:two-component system, NarL family, sensor histidine kinase LiaS